MKIRLTDEHWGRWQWMCIVMLAVVGGFGAGLWVQYLRYEGDRGGKETAGELVVEEEPEPEVVSGGGKMMMTGNIFWGRQINTWSRASELSVAYPFSGLASFEREEYTDWIAGLECPVVDKGGVHSEYDEYTLLKFNCDPDYLPEAAKWFSVVSLGNNHTDNQGVKGWAETKEHLKSAGIQYFGHYDYRDTAEVCNVVAIGVKWEMSDGSEQEGKIPIGMCGWNGVYGIPTEASLAVMKAYAEVMPVIAMPHMGKEYVASHDSLRQNLYRKMIDYGAEMVIGDHSHWVQDTEAYQGRLIVYSMGNFMFDQRWELEVLRSAAIEVEFSVDADAAGWGEVVEECVGDFERCREVVAEKGLEKYAVVWGFGVKGSYTRNGVTGLAEAGVQKGVEERLKWAETVKGLGGAL